LIFTEDPSKENVDLVLTLGGDGTILWAHKTLNKGILPPFMCFDGGSLCFLSNFSLKNCNNVIKGYHNKLMSGGTMVVFQLPRVKTYVKIFEYLLLSI